jgi:hypothetical protein
MTAKKSNESEDLIPTACKIPRRLHERIEELAQYVRGGKSEVMRRAIMAGLPVVVTQRGIHIPKKEVYK